MLVFLVTVKPKAVASDWATYSRVVNRTLKSLTSQTTLGFRVVVVHDELPSPMFRHPNLEYVRLSLPTPQDYAAKENDKALRLLAGMEHASKWPSTYFMPVDSDDLVSTRLAGFLAGQGRQAGWASTAGYIWPLGWPMVLKERSNLPDVCGSALVLGADVASEFFSMGGTAYAGDERQLNLKMPPGATWYDHQRLRLHSGETLKPLPFPATVYTVLSGDNIRAGGAMIKGRMTSIEAATGFVGRLRRRPLRIVTPGFRREFGLAT